MRIELYNIEYQQRDQQRDPSYPTQNDGLKQIDALLERDDEQRCHGGGKRGDHTRNKNVSGIGRPHAGAVSNDRYGNKGKARGMQGQEHHLRIGGRGFAAIELLEALHGL